MVLVWGNCWVLGMRLQRTFHLCHAHPTGTHICQTSHFSTYYDVANQLQIDNLITQGTYKNDAHLLLLQCCCLVTSYEVAIYLPGECSCTLGIRIGIQLKYLVALFIVFINCVTIFCSEVYWHSSIGILALPLSINGFPTYTFNSTPRPKKQSQLFVQHCLSLPSLKNIYIFEVTIVVQIHNSIACSFALSILVLWCQHLQQYEGSMFL